MELNNLKLIKKLLHKIPIEYLSYIGDYLINNASENGFTDVVRELIKHREIITNNNNNYPLRHASMNGHLDIVKILLKKPKVNPSDLDNYAIKNAFKNGHLDIVKVLLDDNRLNKTYEVEKIEREFNRISIRTLNNITSLSHLPYIDEDSRINITSFIDPYIINNQSKSKKSKKLKKLKKS